MKMFIYSFTTLFVIFGIVLIVFSIASRKQPELGLANGQLQPCPTTPNCVCSEYQVEGAKIEPLKYNRSATEAWQKLKQAVSETGGEIIIDEADYLRVIYQTPLLRYIDDVEFRHEKNKQLIHLRSASRVGQSDMGANRKRVEKISKVFMK